MNFNRSVVALFAFVALCSLASAKFNQRKADRLAREVKKDNYFLNKENKNSKKNRQIFEEAQSLMRTTFSECESSVCFLVDGSSALTPNEFDAQLSFVQLAAGTLGSVSGMKFAGAQYGASQNSVNVISTIVDASTGGEDFILDVAATTQVGSNPTFVEGGIKFCINQFNSDPSSAEKMLILGDGQSNFRSGNAITLAANWRNLSPGHDMCAGVIGHGNKQFFVDLTGGVNTKVRRPKNWDLLITYIFDFIEDICGTA